MPTTVNKKLAAQASFIFRGTVKKLGSATMRIVRATKNTVIVTVDEVIQAPEALEDFKGQRVTVDLLQGSKVKSGEHYLFYSNGWMFGESLAVQAIAQKTDMKAAAAAAAPLVKPSRQLHEKLAQARFAAADIVITGRVTSVRVPPEQATLAGATAGFPWKPISEHDPVTQEAVIQVESVQKGDSAVTQVALRFPRSTDALWYKAPKFSPGQQGRFMLHKEERRGKPAVRGAAVAAALSSEEAAGFLTALHPADFQLLNDPVGLQVVDESSQTTSNPMAGATGSAAEGEA